MMCSNEGLLGKGGRGSSWKWSGCSHNMGYGLKFAKRFLDSREKASDLPSRINIHNNRVGRMVRGNPNFWVLYMLRLLCMCGT
jgi:hypothetical protein